VKLSEFEIKQLLDKYRTPEGLIDYKTFCESVEKVFFEEDAAQDALEKHRSKPV
jgi:quinol monooxygenase YgiN